MRLIPNEPKTLDSKGNKTITPEKPTHEQGAIEVARARVQIHYIQHDCFVDGEAILRDVAKLAHIPTIIVQGRYDMSAPQKVLGN